MTTKEYWAHLRAERDKLQERYPSGFVFITSLAGDNSVAGTVAEVSVENAVKLTFARTHRIATPDEVERFRQLQAMNARASYEMANRREGRTSIVLHAAPAKTK